MGSLHQAMMAIISALASFFVVTLIFAAIYLICKARDQRNKRVRTRTRTVHNSDLSSSRFGESANFDPSLHRITMPELLRSTQNFSAELIVGDGGFGLVYKAQLNNGRTVAVKRLSADAFQGFREFRAEMETLSKLQHKNIVKILGFYATGSDRVLVYEFIERGSLDQWLHDTSQVGDDMPASTPRLSLSWETRIKIVKGVAVGLSYLHNLETPIIHRDIKASNVLLDTEFEAHIADFGLARRIKGSHLHVSTQVAGTMGYMPPEYIQGAPVATTMGDVYSFGILMLEIAMRRRPNWPFKEESFEEEKGKDIGLVDWTRKMVESFEEEKGKDIGLVDWTRKMVEGNRQMEMIDANIAKEGLREEEVVEYFKIASLCTNETPKSRPAMTEVVEMLNQLHYNNCVKIQIQI